MDHVAAHIFLKGSSHEIGKTLGELYRSSGISLESVTIQEEYITKEDEREMCRLFDEFCPGINEEIAGFAESLKIPPVQLLYYAETFLCPGCSQIAVLPSISENGHAFLARNYDFGDGVEEMAIVNTKVNGKNAHVASSAWIFGRGDGLNEHGLAVSQSGVGIPVTRNMPNTQRAAIKGLQFWAVIRSVLENCANVDEAIEWIKEMPIAFNINMMAVDKNGCAALIETLDGRKAVKKIEADSAEQFLTATNHAHFPELRPHAPMALKNSVNRQAIICEALSGKKSVSERDLMKLLPEKYPVGLNCRYYDFFFGTIRSQVFDVNAGTMSVRWGTPEYNEWRTYRVTDETPHGAVPVKLIREQAPPDFYDFTKIC